VVGIVWVHGRSTLQSANCQFEFTLFLQYFPHADEGAGGCGVKPDGALQKAFSIVEFLDAGISVG
jgi:hypothetical protein